MWPPTNSAGCWRVAAIFSRHTRCWAELALSEEDDISLARGHFGHAYQLGLTAIRHAGRPYPMPYSYVANRPFFHAGRGLADCLERLDLTPMAIEVIEQILRCDPTDPLDLARKLEALRNTRRPS